MNAEVVLKVILRLLGSSSLCALLFIAVPYDWMNSIHGWLGLGTLPPDPIVGYLSRSLSAFYALTGGLFWVLSFDVVRYRSVLAYLGWAIVALGVVLFFVDLAEGLPLYWTAWEGPFVTAYGSFMTYLVRRLEPRHDRSVGRS